MASLRETKGQPQLGALAAALVAGALLCGCSGSGSGSTGSTGSTGSASSPTASAGATLPDGQSLPNGESKNDLINCLKKHGVAVPSSKPSAQPSMSSSEMKALEACGVTPGGS